MKVEDPVLRVVVFTDFVGLSVVFGFTLSDGDRSWTPAASLLRKGIPARNRCAS